MAAHVTIEMNETVLAQAYEELKLSNPPSFTLNHSGKYADISKDQKVRGMYHGDTNHVDITSQGDSNEREGLYVLTKHIRFTVLHELRHAWQREHWTPEQKTLGHQGNYAQRIEEIDANEWARYASQKYRGLVTIKRRQVGTSGFSRLSTVTR